MITEKSCVTKKLREALLLVCSMIDMQNIFARVT